MRTHRIVGIAIASALALSASGCPFLQSHVKPPKVTLKGVQMTGIDFQHAMLRADLEVANQVPVALSVAKIHWGVKIDGLYVDPASLLELTFTAPLAEN